MANKLPYEYPSTRHRLIGYPYRIWLFSILVFPLLSALWSLIDRNPAITAVGTSSRYLVSLFLLITVLIVPMIVYMISFAFIIRSKLPALFIKLLLALVAIIATAIIVFLLSSDFLLGTAFYNNIKQDFFLFSGVIAVHSFAFSLKGK